MIIKKSIVSHCTHKKMGDVVEESYTKKVTWLGIPIYTRTWDITHSHEPFNKTTGYGKTEG